MQCTKEMIPKTWKKCGAVYSNDQEECVFVCVVCVENIYFVYSTYDAFRKHIQQHHTSEDCQILEEPAAKKRHTELFHQHDEIMSNENNSNVVKNADSTDSYTIGKIQNNIQLLDIFHERLVGNFAKIDEVKDKTEIQLEDLKIESETTTDNSPLQLKMECITSNTHTADDFNVRKTPNNEICSSYTYDQGIYEISDDDDDDEDDEDFVNNDDHGLFTIVNESSAKNYIAHNEMIELSDEDDDEEDKTSTRTNSHETNTKNITNIKEKPVEEVNGDSGSRYKCSQCQRTYLNLNKLIEHLETHEIEAKSIKNTNDSSNKTDPVNCIPTPEVSPNNIDDDQNMNNQLQPYQCNYCPQRFSVVWQLDLHQRLHLSNQEAKRKFKSRPFQCKVCGKRTKTEKAMLIHQRRFHSPESDLDTTQCELCQKRVLTKNLQQHQMVHTKLRYKCNHCEQSYKQKQSLSRHIKKMHPFATTYINPSPQLPSAQSQHDLNTYTSMLEPHFNTNLRQTEHTPLTLGSSQISQPRLTPEEHELMYSFFLHCQSQNNVQTSVSTNAIHQTTS